MERQRLDVGANACHLRADGARFRKLLFGNSHLSTNVACLLLCCALLLLTGGSFAGSVAAQAYETPHGPYEAFPAGCAACHVAHTAAGPPLILQSEITALCLTCHDGTASVFNVVYVPETDIWGAGVTREVYGFGFGTTAGSVCFHPVKNTGNPAVGQVLECVDCHNPHGDTTVSGGVYARLLSSTDSTGRYYQGPDFCLACHGSTDRGFPSVENQSVSYWVYTLGNHRNSKAAHYDTSKAALQPASGTLVTCATCHYKHASDRKRLVTKAEENLCFKCHNTTSNSMSGRNIQAEFAKSSHHDVTGTTGAKVECTSCHGPHTVGAKSLSAVETYSQVANPDNTKSVMARTAATQDNGIANTVGTFTGFCISCHDGSPPAATESTTEYVPYTIVFPETIFTTNSGGWNKGSYQSGGHGGTGMTCLTCHESHGSDYPALQRYDEDTSTTDGECLRCHKSGGGAPDIRSDFLKSSAHPTLTLSGKHSNTENYALVPQADRHAECADCHDVHQATSGSPLRGVSGVMPTYGTTPWATPAYTFTKDADCQYEVCFKCHSYFSYGSSPPTSPSGGFAETDPSVEFNPNNPGYHAVVGISRVPSGYGKFVSPWTYDSPMKCTDCHGSAGSSVAGPHGSTEKFILKAPWNPDTSVAGATGKRGTDTSSHLCFKCHDYNFYAGSGGTGTSKFSGNAGSNLHALYKGNKGYVHEQGCACCHGALPHGSRRRGILMDTSYSPPYSTGVKITGLPATLPDPGTWSRGDCTTAAGCH
ncbi:MAG: cytochrome c3 family protein [Bacillota bacterium]